MTQCILLWTLLSAITVIQAVPLRRLQKRATFYVANETACVVDNIVYSNGEPIPTDDPCETCNCRPPGFACNRKDCRPKPGCRAVRQAGECCPKYECGCEHNGRMYRDGEQIRDEKNPCYECHCQGRSIACAFVDCFFRVDCIPVYVPGQCCPSYKNCSRDVPEKTSLVEDNVLRPGNLLPGLYGETILAREPTYISEEPKLTDPTQPPIVPTEVPEIKDISEEPPKSEFTETKHQEETAESNIEEKATDTFEILVPEEKKQEESTEDILEKKPESVENVLLLNSETLLKEEEKLEIPKPEEKEPLKENSENKPVSTEEIIELPTTIANNKEREETTENSDIAKTDVPANEKPVKNSAADNSKSLKLSNDENIDLQSLDPSRDALLHDESTTATDEKLPKADEIDGEISNYKQESGGIITDLKPELSKNQENKFVKKESAETVTIVVHVRNKTKSSTEKDISIATTTEVPTSYSKATLFKSIDKLGNIEILNDSLESVKTTVTEKNFEIFATTEPKVESTSNVSDPAEVSIESRSEDDPKEVKDEEKVKPEISEIKSDFATTEIIKDVVEASKEEKTDDVIIEESKILADSKEAENVSGSQEQKAEENQNEKLNPIDTPVALTSEIFNSEALTSSEEKPIKIEDSKQPEEAVVEQNNSNEELELKAEPKTDETERKLEAGKTAESEESTVLLNSEEKLESKSEKNISDLKIQEKDDSTQAEKRDGELETVEKKDSLETEEKKESSQLKEKTEINAESPKLEENAESTKSEDIHASPKLEENENATLEKIKEKVKSVETNENVESEGTNDSQNLEYSKPKEREEPFEESIEVSSKVPDVKEEETIDEEKQDVEVEETKSDDIAEKREEPLLDINNKFSKDNIEAELEKKLEESKSEENSEETKSDESSEETKTSENLQETKLIEPKLDVEEPKLDIRDVIESTEESKEQDDKPKDKPDSISHL